MPSRDNPAGRLYLLLDKFRKLDDKTSIQAAWLNVLGIDSKDNSQLLLAVFEVVKLMEEAKKSILLQDVNHRVFLRPFADIQRVFTLSFGHQVANAKPHLNNTVMARLEHCDELLSRTMSEKLIEGEILLELQRDIEELIEKISESDLPEKLKLLLQQNLTSLLVAISYYEIHGARKIDEAIHVALGSTWLYWQQNDKELDESGKELIKRYLATILKAISIVADAYAVTQLGSGAIEKLLPALRLLNLP